MGQLLAADAASSGGKGAVEHPSAGWDGVRELGVDCGGGWGDGKATIHGLLDQGLEGLGEAWSGRVCERGGYGPGWRAG